MAEGAMALFGEKYGDTVRTIRFGQSIELCGGTHASNTANIWHFKITSESAVASGIRRIEAITGDAAKTYFEDQTELLEKVQQLLNQPQDTLKAIESLQEDMASMKKEIQALAKVQLAVAKTELMNEISEKEGIAFLAKEVDLEGGAMKDLAFALGQNKTNLFLVLASKKGGKPVISCYISKELVAQKDYNAGAIVRDLGKHIQGGGGGQVFCYSRRKKPDGIAAALAAANDLV